MIPTDRLVLRPAVDADRDAIAAMNGDTRVSDWLGGPIDRAASDAFVDRVMALHAENGFGFWVVERCADRRVIGMAGVWWVPPEMAMQDQIEIGWRLHPDAWGHGFATEAAEAALDYGFSVLERPEIIAFTARANRASQAVMRRIGMTPAPQRDFDHPRLPADHPLKAHVVFVARP